MQDELKFRVQNVSIKKYEASEEDLFTHILKRLQKATAS